MRCPNCKQIMPPEPRNAGKRWSPDADRALAYQAEWLRRNGETADDAIAILAQRFERNRAGVEVRLARLGIVESTA